MSKCCCCAADCPTELDFDSLCLSASSSAPAAGPNSKIPEESANLIAALRAQLADSHQALDSLKRIVRERVGEEMGLNSGAEVVVGGERKTRGVEAETGAGEGKGKERDDDSHYFESYAYNGTSRLVN